MGTCEGVLNNCRGGWIIGFRLVVGGVFAIWSDHSKFGEGSSQSFTSKVDADGMGAARLHSTYGEYEF